MNVRELYTDNYFCRGTVEDGFYERRELRQDQLATMQACVGSRRLLSIGIGRGFMEEELKRAGHDVVGMDIRDNRHFLGFPFILGGLETLPKQDDFDAIVMVETIEHIPESEFRKHWPVIVEMLSRTHGKFIVSNWNYLWPIRVNGVDHVFEINDHVYDWLCSFAERVIERKGPLLVLGF